MAKALIAELTAAHAFGDPIVTEVLPLANYSAAEDYHQDFFERNPYQGYCLAVAAPKVTTQSGSNPNHCNTTTTQPPANAHTA